MYKVEKWNQKISQYCIADCNTVSEQYMVKISEFQERTVFGGRDEGSICIEDKTWVSRIYV